MNDSQPQIAAATLEHAERIRILTGRVDKQRRSIAKLSYAVGFLVALQALPLMSVALGGAATDWPSQAMARGFLFAALGSAIFVLLFGRKFRTA